METEDWVVRRIPRRLQPAAIIFGGVLVQLSLGGIYTFGNMLPYLISYIRSNIDPTMNSGTLIWLQTLMAGIPFAVLLGGYLEKKIGARGATAIGCSLYTSSVALTYYSIQRSFFLVMITLGLMATSGLGIAYNSVLVLAQQWYPFRIGLASGFIVGGFGFSAFIFSPVQTKYINPENYAVSDQGYFTQQELLDRVPKIFLLLALIYAIFQFFGILLLGRPLTLVEDTNEEETFLSNEKKDPTIRDALKSSTFWLLFCTASLNCLWIFTTSGLFKAYGQKFIKNDFFLAEVSSFASIFNCFSRIVYGEFVDKTSYQACMSFVCVISSLLMWTFPLTRVLENQFMFATWVCAMFSCVGSVYTLLPYITNKCFGKTHFGILYGAIQIALSVAGVGAALLTQFILPVSNFELLFCVVGLLPLISLVLTILIPRTKFGRCAPSNLRS